MGQQVQPWRAGSGSRVWLSKLVEAMERISMPEFRAVPCDRAVVATVRAQLARPVPAYRHFGSDFSMRN